jgi:hypothetical protein
LDGGDALSDLDVLSDLEISFKVVLIEQLARVGASVASIGSDAFIAGKYMKIYFVFVSR